jgi:hypothetical protein
MPRLSLQLLGGLAFALDGEPIHMLAYDQVRAWLGYLVVQSDRLHRRESLAGLLWPDQCPDRLSPLASTTTCGAGLWRVTPSSKSNGGPVSGRRGSGQNGC